MNRSHEELGTGEGTDVMGTLLVRSLSCNLVVLVASVTAMCLDQANPNLEGSRKVASSQ